MSWFKTKYRIDYQHEAYWPMKRQWWMPWYYMMETEDRWYVSEDACYGAMRRRVLKDEKERQKRKIRVWFPDLGSD